MINLSAKFKHLVFYGILLLIPILIIELSLRVFFAYKVGPNIIFFGTKWFKTELQKDFDPRGYYFKKMMAEKDNVMWHTNLQQNYSKYSPGEEKTDYDEHNNKFLIKINRYGFRGKDYEVTKNEGIIRVVTLGASSTFGFRNRDDETYPYYLEVFLNNRIGKGCREDVKGFEVINLGIPHQKASNIYAIFLKEALPLNPDVVTFYEGANDVDLDQVDWKKILQQNKFLQIPLRAYQELRQRLITLAFASNLANNFLIKWKTSHFIDKESSQKKNNSPITLETINKNIELNNIETFNNFIIYLDKINAECKHHQILFVVVAQQATSGSFSRDNLKTITYNDEVFYIKSLLINNESISRWQHYLLCHAILMDKLAKWAYKSNVIFVDGIRVLNHHRDALMSWVHLSPQGNRILAHELAKVIYDNTCVLEKKTDVGGR